MSGSNYQVNLVFSLHWTHCCTKRSGGISGGDNPNPPTPRPTSNPTDKPTNPPNPQVYILAYCLSWLQIQNSFTASNQTMFTGWNHLQPLDWPLPRCELQRKANPMTRVEIFRIFTSWSLITCGYWFSIPICFQQAVPNDYTNVMVAACNDGM